MTQPASDPSNSSVNRRGNGVGEGSGVDEGSGEAVTGIGVGGGVEVGKREGAGVGVASWQAEMRMRHPIRISFFMLLLITKRTALRQYVSGDAGN